eukprot:scaffold1102_cov256-Pinguiococcus_pyrenoidosus.AAC.4
MYGEKYGRLEEVDGVGHDERCSMLRTVRARNVIGARALNAFHGPPFTIQRLAEVLLAPHPQYTATRKLVNGLEKLLSVSSTDGCRLSRLLREVRAKPVLQPWRLRRAGSLCCCVTVERRGRSTDWWSDPFECAHVSMHSVVSVLRFPVDVRAVSPIRFSERLRGAKGALSQLSVGSGRGRVRSSAC